MSTSESNAWVVGDTTYHWGSLYEYQWQFQVVIILLPLFCLILLSLFLRNCRHSDEETQGFKGIVLLFMFIAWVYSLIAMAIQLDIAIEGTNTLPALQQIAAVRTIYLMSRCVAYYFYIRRIMLAFKAAEIIELPESWMCIYFPYILLFILSIYYPIEIANNFLGFGETNSSLFYILIAFDVLLRMYLINTIDHRANSLKDAYVHYIVNADSVKFHPKSAEKAFRNRKKITKKIMGLIKFTKKKFVLAWVSYIVGFCSFLVCGLLGIITIGLCIDCWINVLCLLYCFKVYKVDYYKFCGTWDRYTMSNENSIYNKILSVNYDIAVERVESTNPSNHEMIAVTINGHQRYHTYSSAIGTDNIFDALKLEFSAVPPSEYSVDVARGLGMGNGNGTSVAPSDVTSNSYGDNNGSGNRSGSGSGSNSNNQSLSVSKIVPNLNLPNNNNNGDNGIAKNGNNNNNVTTKHRHSKSLNNRPKSEDVSATGELSTNVTFDTANGLGLVAYEHTRDTTIVYNNGGGSERAGTASLGGGYNNGIETSVDIVYEPSFEATANDIAMSNMTGTVDDARIPQSGDDYDSDQLPRHHITLSTPLQRPISASRSSLTSPALSLDSKLENEDDTAVNEDDGEITNSEGNGDSQNVNDGKKRFPRHSPNKRHKKKKHHKHKRRHKHKHKHNKHDKNNTQGNNNNNNYNSDINDENYANNVFVQRPRRRAMSGAGADLRSKSMQPKRKVQNAPNGGFVKPRLNNINTDTTNNNNSFNVRNDNNNPNNGNNNTNNGNGSNNNQHYRSSSRPMSRPLSHRQIRPRSAHGSRRGSYAHHHSRTLSGSRGGLFGHGPGISSFTPQVGSQNSPPTLMNAANRRQLILQLRKQQLAMRKTESNPNPNENYDESYDENYDENEQNSIKKLPPIETSNLKRPVLKKYPTNRY